VTALGIDLGTANTVVCHARRGVLLDQPSVMVLRRDVRRRDAVAAWGQEAHELLGRVPQGMRAVRPVQDGVVTDLDTARTYLRTVLHACTSPARPLLRSRAVIGVPAGATPLERRALLEAADRAGFAEAQLLPEPVAGAIGCGLDVLERRTHMVVDIGGGTSEVTALCYGGVVGHRSSRVAGDEMTFAVYQYLRREHGLVVGELTAEEIKVQASEEDAPSIVVQGQDAATGKPRLATLEVEEVVEAVQPVVTAVISTLSACLEDLPPQAVDDVHEEGVLAFGGGARMRGLAKQLEHALGFAVRVADRPLTCVAEGAAAAGHHQDAVLHAYAVA
jgi:rod shape-determining protein MreB